VELLQFLADLGQKEHYTISVLFGQCHSGPTTFHHKGKAVDFACGLDTTSADVVGQKYGVSHNFETCKKNSHWHYSVGGR
jgi:hypothetical protein